MKARPSSAPPTPCWRNFPLSFPASPLGDPDSVGGKVKPILSNVNIFGSDLYEAGIGERIEELFKEELAGPGAVRATLKKYLQK